MPLYEFRCDNCSLTFEILARVSEAARKRACPRCAWAARRTVSAFAIGGAYSADDGASAITTPHPQAGHAKTMRDRRAQRPVVPDFARLCWMDDRSAARFAAYKIGRGAEYDDKAAAADEDRKKRGLPAPPAHNQSNSPVARIVARKKAEQAKKAATAVKNRTVGAAPQ